MSISRQHFESIAVSIAESATMLGIEPDTDEFAQLVGPVCDSLAEFNSRFSRYKFKSEVVDVMDGLSD